MPKRILVPALAILLASCGRNTTNVESLLPKQVTAGRWLATVSVGGGMPPMIHHMLRETLLDLFATPSGGGYTSAFHLSDSLSSVSKQEVQRRFSDLQQSIAAFRAENPGAPVMVVLGLTGHGRENGKTYTFKLNGTDELTGAEIASLVRSLNADETILVMQSCNSGELAHRDIPAVFESASLNGFANEAVSAARRSGVRLAVLTPASGKMASPFFTWENILREAARNVTQKAKDFATYADWKNEIQRLSCDTDEFLPPEVFSSNGTTLTYRDLSSDTVPEGRTAWPMGIEPQFYESIPASTPLFLSAEGLTKWNDGTLSFPPLPRALPTIAPEIIQACANRASRIVASMNADAATVLEKVQSPALHERIAYARFLNARKFSEAEIELIVATILEHETHPFVLMAAYDALHRLSKDSLARLPLLSRLRAHLQIEGPTTEYLWTIYEALTAAAARLPSDAILAHEDLIVRHIQDSTDGQWAGSAQKLLGALQHQSAISLLRANLKSDNTYRVIGAAVGLISLRDFSSAEQILERCTSLKDIWGVMEILAKLNEAKQEGLYRPSEADIAILKRIGEKDFPTEVVKDLQEILNSLLAG